MRRQVRGLRSRALRTGGPLSGSARARDMALDTMQDGAMDIEQFLEAACGLLGIPSTADRPDDLHRALCFVVDFIGPGFTVESFESGSKPSMLIYRDAQRPHFQIIL